MLFLDTMRSFVERITFIYDMESVAWTKAENYDLIQFKNY